MTDPSSPQPDSEVKSAIPVPYSVLGAGWVVLIVGAGAIAPQLSIIALVAGPAVMGFKFLADYERFTKIKDNPPPKEYKFHAAGVYAQVDQTIKTLSGFFEKVSVSNPFSDINPPKGQPIHLEYKILLSHPDENQKYQKESQRQSSIYMKVWIKPMGNNCELKIQFKCSGRRLFLEGIMDHIMQNIDELVSVHAK